MQRTFGKRGRCAVLAAMLSSFAAASAPPAAAAFTMLAWRLLAFFRSLLSLHRLRCAFLLSGALRLAVVLLLAARACGAFLPRTFLPRTFMALLTLGAFPPLVPAVTRLSLSARLAAARTACFGSPLAAVFTAAAAA